MEAWRGKHYQWKSSSDPKVPRRQPNAPIVLFPLQWGKPSPSGDSSLPTGAAGDSGPQVSGRRVALDVASNLRPPRITAPSATDPSPGLRPPSPHGRGMGALRKPPGWGDGRVTNTTKV